MRYYLDTSALAKLLVVEVGSETVSEVWGSGAALATCRVSYPEARSAQKSPTSRWEGDLDLVRGGEHRAGARHLVDFADLTLPIRRSATAEVR